MKNKRLKVRLDDYSRNARQHVSNMIRRLSERIDVDQPTASEKLTSRLGGFFEIDQQTTFDQFEFHGPLMHVGSKINYEDEIARERAARFRKFLSGKLHGSTETMGLDIFEGHNVDIVADLCEQDLFSGELERYQGYFKTVLCWALLEHVNNPFAVAANIEKFLAPGGKVFFVGPWVWGYHPYPDDYWRISFSGLRTLFPSIEWHDWWYTGTKNKAGYRINEIRNERKVFQLKSALTADVDTVSDRYMPYLNIFAVGTKKAED